MKTTYFFLAESPLVQNKIRQDMQTNKNYLFSWDEYVKLKKVYLGRTDDCLGNTWPFVLLNHVCMIKLIAE